MLKYEEILSKKQFYKTLYNKNKIALMVLEHNTLEVLDYNIAFKKMFGISDDIMGKYVHNVFKPYYLRGEEDVSFFTNYLSKISTKEEQLFNWQLKNLVNNTVIDLELHIMYIKEKEHEFIFIIFRDVTSNKNNERLLLLMNQELRAANEQLVATEEELQQQFNELEIMQKKLAEKEERYRNIIENIDCVIFECDYNGIVTYMSSVIKKTGGYDPEEVIGTSHFDYLHPEDRKYLINVLRKNLQTNEVMAEDYRLRKKTGEYIWVRSHTKIFLKNGEFDIARGLLFDINEEKLKEKEIMYLNTHDNLTGLKNRVYWEKVFSEYKDNLEVLPLSIIIADINGLKEINDQYGHETGDTILISTAEILQDKIADKGIVARIGGDEFVIMLPNTDEDAANLLIKEIENEIKEIEEDNFFFNLSFGIATKYNKEEDLRDILLHSEDIMYKKKLLQSRSTRSHLVLSLMNVMSEKTHETKEHCQRLEKLGSQVAEKMNLKEHQIEKLKVLAILHDIGKIAIPQYILEKPGKLNEEEWTEMKKHSEIGYRIAKKTPEFEAVAYEILSHHERWDGKGYPQGLKGSEIPLEARIIAVVDAFDAMVTDRSYRKALTTKEAIQELINNAGTQFDPLIIEVFINEVIADGLKED